MSQATRKSERAVSRVYNFCAGPAALPEAVLQTAQAELLDWQGKGLSVMEMSHRSDEFVGIAERAEQDLRDLLAVPSDYKVLFLRSEERRVGKECRCRGG